jgi:hypothetical protein
MMDAISSKERALIDAALKERRAGMAASQAPNSKLTVTEKKAKAAAKKVAEVAAIRDRRRFKQTPVPTGEIKRHVSADAKGTIYPRTVRSFGSHTSETIFKDGAHNSKIGGDVLVGPIQGARIVTLRLEERATCPRSCDHWNSCYGNAMGQARRWAYNTDLMTGIEAEIAALCAKNSKLLVRLHVLGDFPDAGYVDLWAWLLSQHENLHCFGFTAHKPESEIGTYISMTRQAARGRFSIRHSGITGAWGSFTVDFPTEKSMLGDAPVCPEQRDAMNGTGRGIHCGSCGLCWKGSAPIAFVEHG